MSDKEETDSDGALEYEDDFEKDLDWLINEEEKENAVSQNGNGGEQKPNAAMVIKEDSQAGSIGNDTKQDVPSMNGKPLLDTVPEREEIDPEDEEAKRYIAEKIEEANKKLEMEIVDENRQRKLKFKDTLVDLEVPPPEFPDSDRTESITEDDVVDSITKLSINGPDKEESNDKKSGEEVAKDRKILVEKDGKFELVNLQDIENMCSLPPISNNKDLSDFSRLSPIANRDDLDKSAINNINGFVPRPPKARPSSATHMLKSLHKVKPTRRAQSATVSSRNTTFTLSPEQKELQKRIQERQEKHRREEEERKKEEEERKQKENDIAFKVWLQKKREQLLQEKRIQQAKELEIRNTPERDKESQEAYVVWMKRKHREQTIEKKIAELRKQEAASFLEETKDRDGAFSKWLKQKKIQKRAEQQAAKERSRRLLVEARKRKQIHDLLYNISDSKSFRYTDPYS
ncbi:coiled-coil domain-containing protein 181 [Gastrophryne carolinensis]